MGQNRGRTTFTEIGRREISPVQHRKAQYGADPIGHPEKMPPAVLAEDLYNIATQRQLTDSEKIKALKVIHYVFGAVVGVGYAISVKKKKRHSLVGGVEAGATVFAATHGSALPAIGVQGPLKQMPKSWWVWELGSHLVFGGVLEVSRRVLDGGSDNKKKS